MKISHYASKIQPSLTRKLFDRAKQYSDVIDFTLGDPDFQTPDCVKLAACKAINEGRTKYSANAGLLELRRAISDSIYKETGVNYKPEGEIIVTVGAMEALYLSFFCMLDKDDEVIIPAPYWINYRHMTEMCGAKPVIVDSSEENNFIISAEEIEKYVTNKTAAIIINSPNNPTGQIFDKDTIVKLCTLAKKNGIVIIWDECYKKLIYDEKYVSILECTDDLENVVIINSCSKQFSMTGWRVGYAASKSKELIASMTKIQENVAACTPLPSQYAAIQAYTKKTDDVENMRKGYEERRNVLVDGINKISKLSCIYPRGAFYAFVNIKGTGMKSEEFAYALLDSKQVAVVPGITYGECCEGYIRMAYTMNKERINEGLKRIEEFVSEL